MSNNYYAKLGSYQAGTRARGSEVSADYDALVAAFDLLEAVLTKDGEIAKNLDGQSTYKLTDMVDGTDAQDYATLANVAAGGSVGDIAITSLGIGTSTANQVIRIDSGGTAVEGADLSDLAITSFDVGTATAGQAIRVNDAGTAVIGGFVTTIQDDDGDTKVQVEEGADDDTVRIDCATTEVATWTSSTATFNIELQMGDNKITRAELNDTAETVYDNGSAGSGTVTLDYTNGAVHELTTTGTGTVTIAFSGFPANNKSGSLELVITNGGVVTINWPASVDWADAGTAPSLQLSGRDRVFFRTEDGGTTVDGLHRGDFQ